MHTHTKMNSFQIILILSWAVWACTVLFCPATVVHIRTSVWLPHIFGFVETYFLGKLNTLISLLPFGSETFQTPLPMISSLRPLIKWTNCIHIDRPSFVFESCKALSFSLTSFWSPGLISSRWWKIAMEDICTSHLFHPMAGNTLLPTIHTAHLIFSHFWRLLCGAKFATAD